MKNLMIAGVALLTVTFAGWAQGPRGNGGGRGCGKAAQQGQGCRRAQAKRNAANCPNPNCPRAPQAPAAPANPPAK